MTDITIPPEALEAGARVLYPHLMTESTDEARDIARASFTAMVKAWEGMETSKPDPWSVPDRLILPQETQDD